jgi:hypothetical protein
MAAELDAKTSRSRQDYRGNVLRRRWGAYFVPFSCLLPPTYQSETLIQVEQQKVPNKYVVPGVPGSGSHLWQLAVDLPVFFWLSIRCKRTATHSNRRERKVSGVQRRNGCNLQPDLSTLSLEITIIEGRRGEILLRGGQFFTELTPARLTGATLGGSFCKMRGIYVGFRMEINAIGKRIITIPVESIGIVV